MKILKDVPWADQNMMYRVSNLKLNSEVKYFFGQKIAKNRYFLQNQHPNRSLRRQKIHWNRFQVRKMTSFGII